MTPSAPVRDETLVRRLTLLAVCLLLSALACSLDPTRIVGDTKLDLTVNPLGFLYRALYLWDPSYFGQLQNQAYGYLFPNGPFHALLIGAGMPEWVVQRLWMAALLCAAFTGTVAVARALRVGSLPTQVVAGVAFALSPRALTLLSYNSAELQPTMLLPWVLLPLVHGTRPGADPRRAALLSAAAFLLCGGTNAASELAVLVVPLLYLLTRASGRRKWTLLGWWLAAIGLVSFWWLAPLLLMGRYVFSFMPFTEDAATTTSVTSLLNTVRGASNWMGYVPGSSALPAGSEVATTPWLVLATALVAALGLAGAVHRRNPERLFLGASALAGTALVAAGYTGALGGLLGPAVQDLLDGALSPFRNVHKFDVLVRLPVAVGLAHLPEAAARLRSVPGRGPLRRLPDPRSLTAAACALTVLSTLTPLATVGGATRGSFTEIPDYWYEATAWLDARSGGRTTMAVPGSARGEYLWGRPMDEPMQPLMRTPWTNQQIIPWGSAGVSRLTHAVDQRLSSGLGSAGLADALARMGVRYLLVRNDLQREGNNGGWPARVHQALADSPGIDRVRSFGPVMGSLDPLPAARWYDQPYRALDVYAVTGTTPLAATVPADGALRVTGGPEALLALAEQGLLTDDRPVIIGDDPGADGVAAADTVATDTVRRVEVVYPDVRRNTSATLGAAEEFDRDVPAPDVVDPAWEPYTSVAHYEGIAAVTASSAESSALALPARRDPGRTPYAALDGSPVTSWRSSSADGAVGEWLEVAFTEPRDVTGTTVTFERLPDTPPPSKVTVTTDHGSVQTELDDFGSAQELAVPEGETSRLRVRVDELAWEPGHRFGTRVGIASLDIPGLRTGRALVVPGTADARTLLFTGSAGAAPGCMLGSRVWTCHPDLAAQGEDAHGLDRIVTLSADAAGEYVITGQVTAADPERVERAANREGGYPKVTSSSTAVDHPAAMGRGAFDGDDSTVWYPDPAQDRPSLQVDFGKRVELAEIAVEFPRGDTVTRPIRVVLDTGETVREGLLDGNGRFAFATLRTEQLRIVFDPPRDQPLEIAEIVLPGVEPLGPVPDTDAATACGQGPNLTVNGVRVETRISGGTLRDQAEGRPLEFTSCTGVPLVEGTNRITVRQTDRYRLGAVVVRDADLAEEAAEREPVRAEAVEVQGWGRSERRVTVDTDAASYLVVTENFNEGWTARLADSDTELDPVRLDGWKQAWLLPAGTSGTVVLSYTPDTAYHAALLVGAALVAVVLVLLAVLPRTASAVRAAAAAAAGPGRIAPLALGAATVLLGVWSAGWVGCAAALVGLFTASALERRGRRVSLSLVVAASLAAAGLSAAVGGALAAHLPSHGATALLAEPLRGWIPQLLCLPALVGAALALGDPSRRPRLDGTAATGDDRRRDGAARPRDEAAEAAP